MRVNEYRVIDEAVDVGIGIGWTRAHKYTDHPTGEDIRNAIRDAVMNEICEWFVFTGEGHDNNG